jgi:hypothetical protein
MATPLTAFFCGFFAYLLVDRLAIRFSGETSFSLPVGALFVGIICASSAYYLGVWGSLGIFLLLSVVRARDAAIERKMGLEYQKASKDHDV